MLKGSLDGYKKGVTVNGDKNGGSATFSINFTGGCTEQYTLSWTFNKDISRLSSGDELTVSLNSTEKQSCISRTANIGVSWAGATNSIVAKNQLSGEKIVTAFKKREGSTGSSVNVKVLDIPVINEPIHTYILLRFTINSNHGNPSLRKTESVNFEVLYVFEKGYSAGIPSTTTQPGNNTPSTIPSTGGSNSCSVAEQELIKAETKLNSVKDHYQTLVALYADFKKVSKINMHVESGNYSSGINARVDIPGDWDVTWANRLEQAGRNQEVNRYIWEAKTNLKELSDMLFSWGTMRDVSREKLMERFFKMVDKRNEVLEALRNASWSYYCQKMAPTLRELDKINEHIILCDGPTRRDLELRIESIGVWTEWRDNREGFSKKCR